MALVQQSRNTFKKICDNLPYNRNRVYVEVKLPMSKCILYMPVASSQVPNASKVKKFYDALAVDAAL